MQHIYISAKINIIKFFPKTDQMLSRIVLALKNVFLRFDNNLVYNFFKNLLKYYQQFDYNFVKICLTSS